MGDARITSHSIVPDNSSRGRRIPELDGIRGLAIASVIYWHYFVGNAHFKPGTIGSFFTAAGWMSWGGVDLFFVLSGFLIGGILLDQMGSETLLRTFYARRAFRIFPLYFALLVLCFGRAWLTLTPTAGLPSWLYPLYLQNIVMGLRGDWGHPFLFVTWSLAVEEQFYLLLPSIMLFVPRRALTGVIVALIVSAPVVRWFCRDVGFINYTLVRWDSLLLGVVVAIAYRQRQWWERLVSRPRLLTATFAVLVGGVVAITIYHVPFASGVGSVWIYCWLAALSSLLIVASIWPRDTWIRKLLRAAPLVYVGQIAYGLYLFHSPVLILVHRYLRHDFASVDTVRAASVTALALLITVLAAAASFKFFEMPLIRLGHRFRYGAAKPRSVPTRHEPQTVVGDSQLAQEAAGLAQ